MVYYSYSNSHRLLFLSKLMLQKLKETFHLGFLATSENNCGVESRALMISQNALSYTELQSISQRFGS